VLTEARHVDRSDGLDSAAESMRGAALDVVAGLSAGVPLDLSRGGRRDRCMRCTDRRGNARVLSAPRDLLIKAADHFGQL
jgi:hypothetical protein